jgi:hypothetical protein
VLLGLEATGHRHVQYSRIGSTQHRVWPEYREHV